MTPQMKKALAALKKLNAYELATLNTSGGEQLIGNAILRVIAHLDDHLSRADLGYHGLTIEEFQLLQEGKKIQAIKAVRVRMHLGLADSKEIVDKAQAALGLQNLRNTNL